MLFSFWPGASSPLKDTIAICQHAERTGWDGIWYADHFMPNLPDNSGPTNEVFTAMAALAVSVPRVRIGTLVLGNTYRHPAVTAKAAAGVDILSEGRLVLGLGSGWQENEHTAYGIEFSTIGGRLARLAEACEVITGLLNEERTTFAGKYYQLAEAPLAPKPVQRPVPILIGGGGEEKTMRITAKYAQEWNTWGLPAHLARKMAVLDQRCEEIGRDPKSLKRSANATIDITTDAEEIAKLKATGRPVIAGSVSEVRDVMAQYVEAGVDEFIVPDFNLGNTPRRQEVMDTFINEVAPSFR
ncbi:MAG: TIGR03560 family F420-dependent LLM class oxidoreductase [Tepidiformaceae bacterium]